MKTPPPDVEQKVDTATAQKTAQTTKEVAEIYKNKWIHWFASLQCVFVVCSYQIKIFVVESIDWLMDYLFSNGLWRFFGEILYSVGFQAEYQVLCFARWTKKVSQFFMHFVFAEIVRAVLFVFGGIKTIWEELFRPFYVFFRGLYRLFAHGAKVTKERNIFFGIWACICYLFRGLRLYIRLLPGMVSYVLPVIAAVWFLTVLQTSRQQEYTLAVQVDGKTVGYVESEMVFEAAKEDVEARVNYSGTNAEGWNVTPTYTLAYEQKTLSESEMADEILSAASEEITEGTALYVDGNLYAITEDGKKLRAFFDGLIEPYLEPDNPNVVVSFNKEIEMVDGIFFTDSFTDCDGIIEAMSGLEAAQLDYTVVAGDSMSLIASKNGLTLDEFFGMNPGVSGKTSLFPGDKYIIGLERAVLEVLIVRTEEYDETIPYQTITTSSDEYAFGSTKVTQQGVDGTRHVTAEVTYDIHGNVLEKIIISNPVTVEPIDKITVRGTRLASGDVAQVGSGTMIWPVPGYTYCSRWASAGHKGVDICAAYGTTIYAVDSGVVTVAGFSAAGSGYGNSLIINHGNGYTTLYGHASALYVSAGQSVTQGQPIAAIGSTGWSTGNHLHLEIKYNGSIIYPQNIFGGK